MKTTTNTKIFQHVSWFSFVRIFQQFFFLLLLSGFSDSRRGKSMKNSSNQFVIRISYKSSSLFSNISTRSENGFNFLEFSRICEWKRIQFPRFCSWSKIVAEFVQLKIINNLSKDKCFWTIIERCFFTNNLTIQLWGIYILILPFDFSENRSHLMLFLNVFLSFQGLFYYNQLTIIN